jgi:cobalt-zinc-cadmium efflux system outer membrane protein
MRCLGLRLEAIVMAVACLLLSGCASLDPEPEWQEVQALVYSSTPAAPVWQRSEADTQAVNARVSALLEGGITRQEAVEIAISNDPRLQVQFDTLGIAKADYVQAGLFTNPAIGAFVGFPLRLDGSAITLLTLLSDLWVVPARQAVAETELQETVQLVSASILATVFETMQAYDAVLYREALYGLEQRALELRQRAFERAAKDTSPKNQQQVRSGAASAELGAQEINVARAERDRAFARHALAQALRLPADHLDVALTDGLDEPAEGGWSEERAVAFASERRLDLAAARLRVEEARRRGTLARRSRLGAVGVGPGYNGAFGDDDAWGPSLAMSVPIFDWNQAQVSSAVFQERRSIHQLAALEAQARREVADALAERAFFQQQADVLELKVNPALQQVIEASEPGASQDLAEYLHWIVAQQKSLEARRSYVTSLWNLRGAYVRLQRSLFSGGGGSAGGGDAGSDDGSDDGS